MVDRIVLGVNVELSGPVGSLRRSALARNDDVVAAPDAQFLDLQFRDQDVARSILTSSDSSCATRSSSVQSE